MADPPSQDGYVDPDVPRGVGVYNPSNRIGSQLPTRLVPQENSQQAKADTLSGKERVRSQVCLIFFLASSRRLRMPVLGNSFKSCAESAHLGSILSLYFSKFEGMMAAEASKLQVSLSAW